MRKLLLLMMFVFMSANMCAQKSIGLNRDFKLSGKLWAYTETETGEDVIIANKGAIWHLTNEFVAGRNHVKFWITMPEIEESMFPSRWSAEDIEVRMITDESNNKNYYVNDAIFNHLMIMQTEGGYLVRNCSVLIEP